MAKLNKFILTVFCLTMSATAFAATVGPFRCQSIPWLLPRTLTLPEISGELQHLQRHEIVEMAWHELLNNPTDAVTMPLLHYLAVTAPKASVRTYFESLGFMASGEYLPSESVKSWPKRVPTVAMQLTLPQMCQLYAAALATPDRNRNPDSVKKKAGKKAESKPSVQKPKEKDKKPAPASAPGH